MGDSPYLGWDNPDDTHMVSETIFWRKVNTQPFASGTTMDSPYEQDSTRENAGCTLY